MSNNQGVFGKDDEYQVGVSGTGCGAETSGVTAEELITASVRMGFAKKHLQTLLEAAGLSEAELKMEKVRPPKGVDLLAGFAQRAIKVTKVRNKLGVGTLMRHAQQSVQIIRNERTRTSALVLSENLLEEILQLQVNELATQLRGLEDEMGNRREERFAARSRKSFMDMLETMETVKGNIPTVEGSATASDIAV